MPAKGGAGASIAAGTSYQSRIAAYAIASSLCQFPIDVCLGTEIRSISFETANAVDDINLTLIGGERVYIQAKRQINFSPSLEQEFGSSIDQFVRQSIEDRQASSFFLITTSESSRRITCTLSAVADALRSGSEEDFYRDQNKSMISDFELLRDLIKRAYFSHTKSAITDGDALEIIRKIRISIIDIGEGSSLEQACWLLLNARRCVSPELFWGKLISDCNTYASQRRSLTLDFLSDQYRPFFSPLDGGRATQFVANAMFQILDKGELPTGREVVLGTLNNSNDKEPPSDKLFIFEFYRFDSSCNERIAFDKGRCLLGNGLDINVLRRTATFAGLERFLKRQRDRFKDREIVIVESNIDDDQEQTKCAVARRQLLRASIPSDDSFLKCVHCGRSISSNDVDLIEFASNGVPTAGLSHEACTLSDDRVVGAIQSEFFTRYDFLRNFDAPRWMSAINNGQGAFAAASSIANTKLSPTLFWSGRSRVNSIGDYVIEAILDNGNAEYLHHRGQLDRFSKSSAETFRNNFLNWIRTQNVKSDPLCYSEETKQFAARSTLLQTLGVDERFIPIVDVRIGRFNQKIAARYDIWKNWYAPLAYVKSLEDDEVVGVGGSVFLVTRPFRLDRFLDNWKNCGLRLNDYSVGMLASDDAFDDFARDVFGSDRHILIDPLFHIDDDELHLVNGIPLISQAQLIAGTDRPDSVF